jgi:hypothetical protein
MATLAQLQAVDPAVLKDVLLVLAFLVSTGCSILALVRTRAKQTREISPQPLEVDLVKKLVSTDKCKLIHDDTNRRIVALEEGFDTLRREAKADQNSIMDLIRQEVGSVHVRVNELVDAVGQLRGEIRTIWSKATKN